MDFKITLSINPTSILRQKIMCAKPLWIWCLIFELLFINWISLTILFEGTCPNNDILEGNHHLIIHLYRHLVRIIWTFMIYYVVFIVLVERVISQRLVSRVEIFR